MYIEAARLSSGSVRPGYPDIRLFTARSAVVRRRHRPSHLTRPQSAQRIRRENTRGKTTDHRHQVRSTDTQGGPKNTDVQS